MASILEKEGDVIVDYRPVCWMQTDSYPIQFEIRIDDGSFIHSKIDSIIGGIGMGLISIGGTFLNILIIIILLRSSKLRSEYLTPFIVSMSLADFAYSIFGPPIQCIRYFTRTWPEIDCSTYALISYSLWNCSAWNLLGIALIRCIVVSGSKIKSTEHLSLICKTISIVAWFLSFLSFLPTYLEIYGIFGLQCKIQCCRLVNVDSDGNTLGFQPEIHISYVIMTMGIIVGVLNSITYWKVSTRTRKLAKQMKQVSKEVTKDILEKEKKAGAMILIITASFFIVFLTGPLSRIIDPNFFINHPSKQIGLWLIGSSIVIVNPLVYILFQDQYRREIKSLFLH